MHKRYTGIIGLLACTLGIIAIVAACSQPAAPAPDQTAAQPTAIPTVALLPTRPPLPTATAAPREVVMEVTEDELQTRLRDTLVGQSLGSTPFGDARLGSLNVRFDDQLVRVDGGAQVGFINSPFSAAGTVAPNAAGHPMVTVSEATLGGVRLPDNVRNNLAGSVQSQVDQLFDERKMNVRTITIDNGKMTVVGTDGS